VVTIESLCRCDPPTCRHDHVTLTRADVELWSLNWTKLARALCHAFSLNYQFADLRPCNTRQIGSWSADAVPVILTIQSQRGFFYSVITELIARLHQKFILLAPTAKHFDAGCQELLANANAAFFPLDSNVILNPNGVLECVKEPSDLFSPISVPMLSPRSPDSVRRDSKFKVHGSTFDVRAAGPVPSPLATHNSLSASGGEGRGEVVPSTLATRHSSPQVRRRYLEQELLEVSAVGIPANPNALALGLKSGAIQKSDLRDLSDLIHLTLDREISSPITPMPPISPNHQLVQMAKQLHSILRS
jgi:hypothetical protein